MRFLPCYSREFLYTTFSIFRKTLLYQFKKSMYKKIRSIAFPIILTNLLQLIYQMTDLFRVGRESKEWVAAIALAWPIIFFFVSLGIGLTIAGTILVAQHKGKKDYDALNPIIGQSLILTTIFSISISIVGYFLSQYFISWMYAEPLVSSMATGYLKISFLWLVFVFGFNVIQSFFRGLGEVKIPMYIMLLSVILNFILDPLLIIGHKNIILANGINGAAYATIITQGISAIVGLIVLYRQRNYNIHREKIYFRIHQKFIKKFLALAIPSGIEMSSRSLGVVILAYIIAKYGTDITAAYGVGNQVFSIVLFIAIGFGMATTTLVGQSFWAQEHKNIELIKNKSIILSTLILTVLGLIIFIFAHPFVKLFVPKNPEVAQIATTFVKILALFFGTVSITQIISGTMRGVGETKIPMLLTMILLRALNIPIAYFGSKYFGPQAIRWSFSLANILTAIIAWIWYQKKKTSLIYKAQ